MTPTYLISIGYATDAQRNAVQAKIKKQSTAWWHHLPDTWIVRGGGNHTFWADLLKPDVAGTTARLLVLKLPDQQEQRMFAVRGGMPQRANKWLWETYYGKPQPPKK